MGQFYHYRLFGLRLRSELPLPELVEANDAGHPDVVIRVDAVAGPPEASPGLHGGEDGAPVLLIPDVGRYRIDAGREIVVDPNAGVPERNVRLFLLGSAMGLLLHQRGLLPLHANAIEIGGKAVAFMGESGAGKSTLAAWFYQQGYDVIADDVCVIGFDENGQALAAPGLPRLRLWAEALELMGHDSADYNHSYIGNGAAMEKFDVPIAPAAAARSDVELAALYLLDRGDEFSVARFGGMEAAEAVFANTYRGSYLDAVNGKENHWQSAVKLVRNTPVYRVTRQWALAKLDDQCRRLRDHATAVVGSSGNSLS